MIHINNNFLMFKHSDERSSESNKHVKDNVVNNSINGRLNEP